MSSIAITRLGAVILILFGLGLGTAQAQRFEGEGFEGIFKGLGLSEDNKGPVNTRERAPLVVPPSRTLPPPVPKGSALAGRTDFPVDADATDARRALAAKKFEEQSQSGRLLTHDEMQADRLEPGTATKRQPIAPGDRERNTRMSPKELSVVHERVAEDNSWAKGEPPRKRLSDPPAGFRTPSANAPYSEEAGKPAASESKGFWSRINPF